MSNPLLSPTKTTHTVVLFNENNKQMKATHKYDDIAKAEDFASWVVGSECREGLVARSAIYTEHSDGSVSFEGEFEF